MSTAAEAYRWDAAGERLHALMVHAPEGEDPTGVAAAEWLGFRALVLFPCFPVAASRLATTAFVGGDRLFTWPLWNIPITLQTLRSLLSDPHVAGPDRAWRKARGVSCVFRALVRRSDKGYGTFGAAELLSD